MAKYIIGTGYYSQSGREKEKQEFFLDYWLKNTLEGAQPEKIVIVNSAAPTFDCPPIVEWINLTINPGHATDLDREKSDIRFGGWSIGFIMSALYAHSCGCDFLYKEQDCLCFGPWMETLLKDLSGYQMITGELWNYPSRIALLEVCLTYIRYDFIIPFLTELFSIQASDRKKRNEEKFLDIRDKHPGEIGVLSFGYGGNRPYNLDDPVFYLQRPRWDYKAGKDIGHFTHLELGELREKGLV